MQAWLRGLSPPPTHRNGYRECRWDTRVGTIELPIPRVRHGSDFLPLSTRAGAPSEPLPSVVQDAYLAGVSTPRVEALVDALGIASLSTSEMGRIRAAPVTEVVAFRIPASGCTVAALTGGSAGT